MYIHELTDWPGFTWNLDALTENLATVQHKQGRLLGKMESLGFKIQQEANLEIRTKDVLKTSEIEGELLDHEQVRSSLARRLQMKIPGLKVSSASVDGIVDLTVESTQNFNKPLTRQRLFSWHESLFPDKTSGLFEISVGRWRDDRLGPMQVVSGRGKVHFEAPSAKVIPKEMQAFIKWIEQPTGNLIIKSGVAHLWFLTIHPFEDGNGRIARAIADMLLARADGVPQRFYSMSSQINKEQKQYYEILERTQKNSLDITRWLEWYLGCLERAIESAHKMHEGVLQKAKFWEQASTLDLNERQRKVLNKLLDGFEGNMTTSRWARIAKCSQDTAHRDILALMEMSLIRKEGAGGRSTYYSIKM